MLQIKDIHKEYRTGDLVQKALDGVSLNLRDNEFVAVLGPSGSGKTTLLNIIGGLDRYDSGDLIINGISTKKYKDRDWDSYRNHTIGFVFQSYNLIPHQTVLSNVELALTISGISRAERKKRAEEALRKVGLGEQMHKKPSQMSGGQMQRVAIARALVNDPDILLADEPTGALDSETSVQVMDLLKEVAEDRLVVMVTHNPELAEQYATRIVRVKDGHIIDDSDPYEVEEVDETKLSHANMGKSSMSFLTALFLSFNNLKTKAARTILVAFAGSIGIIGIAAILSLSNGVNTYIKDVEEDALTQYPLQITSSSLNLSSALSGMGMRTSDDGDDTGKVHEIQTVASTFTSITSNDMGSLKEYLESDECDIDQYVQSIEYTVSVEPVIYKDNDGTLRKVNPNSTFNSIGIGTTAQTSSLMSSMMNTNVFNELPSSENLYKDQYEVMAGHWPENRNECVLVVTGQGGTNDMILYTMGLKDPALLDELIEAFAKDADYEPEENEPGTWDYEDFLGIEFKVVNGADLYQYDEEYGVYVDKSNDEAYVADLVENAEPLVVSGVVKGIDGSMGMLKNAIYYTKDLSDALVDYASTTEIVQKQLADPSINVLTGKAFTDDDTSMDLSSMFSIDEEKMASAFNIDTSVFNSLDYSSLDLSGIDMNMDIDPEAFGSAFAGILSEENITELLSSIQFNPDTDALSEMASSLQSGYEDYVKNHPDADYRNLSVGLQSYLSEGDGLEIISRHLKNMINTNTDTEGALEAAVVQLLNGLSEYLQNQEITSADDFNAYVQGYFSTNEGKAALASAASALNERIADNAVTEEKLKALSDELSSSYDTYAEENGFTTTEDVEQGILNYMNTEQAQSAIRKGANAMINTDELEEAASKMGASASDAVSDALAEAMAPVMSSLTNQITTAMQSMMGQVSSKLENAFSFDTDAFQDAIQMNMSEDEMTELLTSMMSSGTVSYDSNLKSFSYADMDSPSEIDIYPKDFESKEKIVEILDEYNTRMEKSGQDEKVISYTDLVGVLMSSVTDIINVISYVLVAFVAISLVVSSIMIGVITYISVLERNKEIGILRAIGASKRNISEVFNAETFIIGLLSGMFGIGITLLLLIPANMIIHHIAGNTMVNAVLPAKAGVILILLSVVLTMIGGLIPSRKAANSDPVAALRSE